MQLLEVMRDGAGGGAIATLARAHGISEGEVEAVVAAVVPEFARRIERNSLSRGGTADIVAALGHAQQLGVLDQPARLADPALNEHGIAFLDTVLGGKEASRSVAHRAALASGLGEGLIKMMLPAIAAMIMNAIARRAQGGLGDILSRIPGVGSSAPAGGGPGLPMPDLRLPESGSNGMGGARTGGGFGSGSPLPLPIPGEGSGSDGGFTDILRRSSGSGSPLPLPDLGPGGGGNPYGDLSDILRRGGGSAGSSPLWAIVRNLIGGILGFQSRGLVGWIVRAVVMRWGWSLLRMVLGRALLRR
jgi:hypothetical protein